MNLRSNEAVIRMGPITVIALLILIALATLGVLSLTTAQASQTAVTKQDAAIQALYANEMEAQQFLADLDAALVPYRASTSTPRAAVQGISASGVLADADIDGITIQKSFENDARKLTVIVVVREDLNYQIVSWKTASTIDTTEQIELWQGEGTDSDAGGSEEAENSTGSGTASSENTTISASSSAAQG